MVYFISKKLLLNKRSGGRRVSLALYGRNFNVHGKLAITADNDEDG